MIIKRINLEFKKRNLKNKFGDYCREYKTCDKTLAYITIIA